MSMEYIRRYYGVPAKRGMTITFQGEPCVIVGSQGAHLRVRVSWRKRPVPIHPTWEVVYPDAAGGKQ